MGLKLTGGAVTEVVTNQGNFSTPTVVDAAGAWGDRIAAMVEAAIPLTVCRHNICFVKRPGEAAAGIPCFTTSSVKSIHGPRGKI